MRVFINYKQDQQPDHEFARQLESRLRAAGIEVFRDESDLKAGEKWTERLQREIEACTTFVSIISNASLKST